MALSRLGTLGFPVEEILMNSSAEDLFNKCKFQKNLTSIVKTTIFGKSICINIPESKHQ
jgi:hypothetical protein